MVAIGKVVFTSREHIIALEARGKGMMGVTLRYPYEVRKEVNISTTFLTEKLPKDMLELATHIVETKKAHFEPENFEDRYEDALKDLLKKSRPARRSKRHESASRRKSSILWMRSGKACRLMAAASAESPSGALLLIAEPQKRLDVQVLATKEPDDAISR